MLLSQNVFRCFIEPDFSRLSCRPREDIIRELMRREYDKEEETFISLALNWSTKVTVELLGDTIAKVLAKAVKDAQKKKASTG